MSRSKTPRRRFLQLAATAAATGAAVSCSGRKSPWRFFTVEEAATAAAVCDRIIPPDSDPGAAETGAVNFLDRQLVGHYRRFRKAYRDGLAGTEQSAAALFGKKFPELPAAQQDQVLKALEKDAAPGEIWKRTSAKQFFAMMVTHTMQGFYGDPRHGGNRDGTSWRMLGVTLVPLRGRAQYDLTTKS